MNFQGIRTSIAKKPYSFVIFQGAVLTHSPPPPLDLRMFPGILTSILIIWMYKLMVLIDFSLTVKAATLIFISGRGLAISSANQGDSGSIYNLVNC